MGEVPLYTMFKQTSARRISFLGLRLITLIGSRVLGLGFCSPGEHVSWQ